MAELEGDSQQADAQETITPAPAEVEAKARELGWKPKDKWDGPADKWKPADEWITVGEEIRQHTKTENQRLRDKLAKVEKESTDKIARLEHMNSTALNMQRSQIESRYESLKEKAVELGDTKAYKEADKGQKDALKEFDAAADSKPATVAGKTKTGLPEDDEAVLDDWLKANASWYARPTLRGAADEAWNAVEADMPGASFGDKLAAVKARVQEEFPQAFGRKPNGAARVEGANGRGSDGGDGGSEQWSKLPAEAKQQADRFIKDERLYDPPGKKKADALTPGEIRAARERYAQQYFTT